MSSKLIMRAMIGFYLLIFFLYLFGPLFFMGVTAFNTPNYPTAFPFEQFTWKWFNALFKDRDMMDGLLNSVIIGLGVVALSVPIGVAASIVMQQIYWRARGLYYLITVSPVLTPGVIIGISTVIFWKDFSEAIALKPYLYKGIILSIIG